MTKLFKNVKNFSEVIAELMDANYSDDVLGNFAIINDITDFSDDVNSTGFKDMIESVIEYIRDHTPGYFNPTYPNCINANIGPYGFNYTKDGRGIGVSSRIDRKTFEVNYTITFYFTKDTALLKYDDVFNYAMENGYELIEPKNVKKYKHD